MAAGDAAPERPPFADEMLLADELVEAPRAHPCRKWLLLGWRLEEGFRPSAGQSGRGAPSGHGPMVRGHGPEVVGAATGRRDQIAWVTFTRMSMIARTPSNPPPTMAIRRTSRRT